MAARGAKNGQRGFLALPSTLQNKFFDSSTPSMRKVDDGGENRAEMVATNIVDSRPLKCQTTGSPIACAKTECSLINVLKQADRAE